MSTIGQATRLPHVIRIKVRAETDGLQGDLDADMDLETFRAQGWMTERPIDELAEGESTGILPSE